MKKIIAGKVYDTSTAKQIGFWSNGRSYSDFSFVEETLYQKRTGEFFLHGSGGPMSKYSESHGYNTTCGGEQIMPLTYKEANEWAMEYLDADEYEAIFGKIIEDDSKHIISTSILTASYQKLKRLASEKGQTIGEIIDSFLA